MARTATGRRAAALAILILFALLSGACRQRTFLPATNEYIPDAALPSMVPLDASVWIAPVVLSEKTGNRNMTSNMVFPEHVRDAVRNTLKEARMFRVVSYSRMVEPVQPADGEGGEAAAGGEQPSRRPADYELHTVVGVVDHEGYSSTTARVLLQYVLKETATDQVLWRRNLLTKYEISASEIRWDVERVEKAYSGAVRTNIYQMAQELAAYLQTQQ